MVRRWLIRSVAILICCVTVVACLLGFAFPISASMRFGGEKFVGIDWISTDVVAFMWDGSGSDVKTNGFDYYIQRSTISVSALESSLSTWSLGRHFAGFGFGRLRLVGPAHFVRVPLWFLSLLSVFLLVWIFRRTKAKTVLTAFPIEAKQTV